MDKNVRFREANFEFGEQIAVLGIVRQITDERGEQRKVLCPVRRNHSLALMDAGRLTHSLPVLLQVNYEVFTEEFCQKKGWSDWDRRSWRDLTKEPSIILTDMPDYFQVRQQLCRTGLWSESNQSCACARALEPEHRCAARQDAQEDRGPREPPSRPASTTATQAPVGRRGCAEGPCAGRG